MKPSRKGMFPDYECFLERSLVLHGDVLALFLVELKEHLELVQVFLGKIEAWMMEPIEHIKFLDETFYKRLRVPEEADNIIPCDPRCMILHQPTPMCELCLRPWNLHSNDLESHQCFLQSSPILLESYWNVPFEYSNTFHIDREADQRRLKKFLEYVLLVESHHGRPKMIRKKTEAGSAVSSSMISSLKWNTFLVKIDEPHHPNSKLKSS
jgi:hypothetical protein